MITHAKRILLFLLLCVCQAGAVEVPLDESFAPKAYGYAEVPVLVWNDVSEWLYVIAEEDADRFNGQDLTSNLLRLSAQGVWDQTWAPDLGGSIATEMIMRPDGKLVVALYNAEEEESEVIQFNVDGTLDNTFHYSVPNDVRVEALALDHFKNLLVGTYGADNRVYKVSITGPQLSFDSVPLDGVRAIAVDGSNNVYVGGLAQNENSPVLYRYNSSGSRDTSFSVTLPLNLYYAFSDEDYYPEVFDLAITSTGLWVAGFFDYGLVEVTESYSNININPLYVGTGFSAFDKPLVRSLHVTSTGQVYLSGGWYGLSSGGLNIRKGIGQSQFEGFALVNGSPVYGSYKEYEYQSDPALYFDSLGDASENIRLLAPVIISQYGITADGAPLLFGRGLLEMDRVAVPSLALLNNDGSLNTSFIPDIEVYSLYDVLPLPNGRIVIAGNYAISGDESTFRISLFEPDGQVVEGGDLLFSGRLTNFNTNKSMWLLPTGKIFVGARDDGITSIAGQSSPGVVLLDFMNLEEKLETSDDPWTNGVIDANFSPTFDGDIYDVAGDSHGRILISTGTELMRFLPDGSLDSSFSPASQFINFSVHRFACDGQERIYISKSSVNKLETLDGLERMVFRLHPDGSLDATFTCSVYANIMRDIQVTAEGAVYISGTYLLGGNHSGVFRLHQNGDIDTSFLGSGSGGYADEMAISPLGYIYIASDYRHTSFFGRFELPEPLAPQVSIFPGLAQCNEGEDITFWLAERGAEETYQWLSNGAALQGQTGPSLTLDPASLANAGVIGVQATGPGGSVTRTATLNVAGYDFAQWGAQQGYTEPELADPAADLNGDGFSLNDEYLLRTDLFGPATRTWASPVWDDGALTIQFTMLPGRRYWIDCSTNLVNWTPIDSYTSDAAEPVAIKVAFDPETPCFYQVRVEAI